MDSSAGLSMSSDLRLGTANISESINQEQTSSRLQPLSVNLKKNLLEIPAAVAPMTVTQTRFSTNSKPARRQIPSN